MDGKTRPGTVIISFDKKKKRHKKRQMKENDRYNKALTMLTPTGAWMVRFKVREEDDGYKAGRKKG